MTREELRAMASRLWAGSNDLLAKHYDTLADIDRLDGDPLHEEFHRALAACYRDEPGAQERKDKAHAALNARHAEAA